MTELELTGKYRFSNRRCGLFSHNVLILQVEVREWDNDNFGGGDWVKYFRDAGTEDLLELEIYSAKH